MDAFSYLSVLLSIILGLAITQVLQGYRALLLARGRVRLYAPPLIWSAVVLFAAVQAWWASFGLRDHETWTFATFTVILAQMVMIYMQAGIVLPDLPHSETIDLADHHERHRKAFFGFLLAGLAASLLKDLMLDGSLPEAKNLFSHAVGALIAILGILLPGRWAQLALAIAGLVGLANYVAELFAEL